MRVRFILRSGLRQLLLAALLTGVAVCAPGQAAPAAGKDSKEAVASEELLARCNSYVNGFEGVLEQVLAELERTAAAKQAQRAAALWRVRMAAQCDAALTHGKPMQVMSDLWTVFQQTADYLTAGEGKALFAAQQPVAVKAAQDVLVGFEAIPRETLNGEAFNTLQTAIREHARQYPITGEFVFPVARVAEDTQMVATFRRILDLPLVPFNALTGIGKAPDSVRDVSAAVDRFREVVADFPANARWQMKLLALDAGETPAVVDTVGSIKGIAESADRFSHAFEDMPGKLSLEVEKLLRQVNDAQPEWRRTLAETRGVVELVRATTGDLGETIGKGDKLVTDVQGAADALEKAAKAVTVTAQEILKFVPASAKDANGQLLGTPPPAAGAAPAPAPVAEDEFSFQAVTASAEALTQTAQELQRLLAEIKELAADAGRPEGSVALLDQRLEQRVDASAQRVERIVDRIAVRALQLLLLAFVLALAYRVIARRFQNHQPTEPRT